MTGLDRPARYTGRVHHLIQTRLARGVATADDPATAPARVRGRRAPRKTAPGSKRSDPPQTPRRARSPRRAQPVLHQRHQPAQTAGFHQSARKLHRKGCRDRRSLWPPPWSTSIWTRRPSAPFLSTPAPRPHPATPRRSPQNAGKTEPTRRTPRNSATPAPRPPHPHHANPANRGNISASPTSL